MTGGGPPTAEQLAARAASDERKLCLTAGLVLEDMIRANNVIEAVSSFF